MACSHEYDTVLTKEELDDSLRLYTIKAGMTASRKALRELLPEIEDALFFAKLYRLTWDELSGLITELFSGLSVIDAIFGEDVEHSYDLQDYIVEVAPPMVLEEHGNGKYSENCPPRDTILLRQLFEAASTEIATSLQTVANKLSEVLGHMSTKYGAMTFSYMRKLNTQRNSIGTYSAQIVHERTAPRLVILDVSSSMTEETVRAIVSEVVSFAYAVNASLAIVSNHTYLWEAGSFDEDTVLNYAEYGGTHYETLAPVLDMPWETVITIADYDSSTSAKEYLERSVVTLINEVFDISLVNRPTYLAECVGQFAKKVTPLLIGKTRRVLQ